MNEQNMLSKKMYERYISTLFGKTHKDIAKEFKIYSRYFRKNYSRVLPKNKNVKILDIGCGMGHFLYYLEKEEYRNYIGIDISEENINFCKEKGFKVKQCDAFAFLEDNKEPFNIIIMNDILEHLDKEEVLTILKLTYRNLTDAGKIIIKVPSSANPLLGSSTRYIDFTHAIGFTEESLTQVMEITGFQDVKIFPQDIFVFYLNPLNYLAKFAHGLLNILFRALFLLYGRKTTKIFTKSIIGVGTKL